MKIGIYGLGRFGQFWAEFMASQGQVLGYNRSPKAVSGSLELVDIPTLCTSDVVFLCSAISSIPQVCRELAPHLGPDTLICDTCSVKVFPANTMAELLPGHTPILPLHPMFGPDSANPENHDLPLVLCPDPRNLSVSSGLFIQWKDRFENLGFRVIPMTPQEHDQEAARTQGITHFVGRMLAELGLSQSSIATLGYKKIFEVMEQTCNDPWQLFLDLQQYNPYTRTIRADMERSFRKLMNILETLTEDSTQ